MIRSATLSLSSPSPCPPRRKSPARRYRRRRPFIERFSAHAPLSQRTPARRSSRRSRSSASSCASAIWSRTPAPPPTSRSSARPTSARPAASRSTRVIEAVLPHEIVGLETRGLTEIMVTRASRAITAEDIETRITQRARRPVSATPTRATSRSTFDSDAAHASTSSRAPTCGIARMTFDPRSGRFDVLFELPGARAQRSLRFTGTYAETFEAAVLARPLAARRSGARRRRHRSCAARRSEFAANIITTAEQAIGLAARRAMRPGEVLRQTDLMKPEVVARNDNVTITYQVPGIVLTMRGKALEGRRAKATPSTCSTSQSKRIDPGDHRRARPRDRDRDHRW